MSKKLSSITRSAAPAILAITPGKTRGFLETRKPAQGCRAALPVLTIRGAKPGPLAVITAAQHGREVNAIASIERAFEGIDPARLSGTVVFLPVMNPVGVLAFTQDYPTEKPRYRSTPHVTAGHNMGGTWSGLGGDTYGGQITSVVWDTYLKHADIALDMHAWPRLSLPLAWGHEKWTKLVRAFGLPWHMLVKKLRNDGTDAQAAAYRAGFPLMVVELPPQNMVERHAVRHGERGILNLLKHGGLLKGSLDLPPVQYEFNHDHVETLAHSPVEGLCVSDFAIGELARKGQTVARVISLDTLETLWQFKAPHDALVFYLGGSMWGEDHQEHSVVFPGQMVALLKKVSRTIRNR